MSSDAVVEKVEINLCIGLLGVCIIGLLGDESDGVYSHIDELGPEAWYDQLPPHEHPVEGIYTIVCNVAYTDESINYSVVSSKCDD